MQKNQRPKTPFLLILLLCCLPACALVALLLNQPERQPKPQRHSVRPPLPTYDPKLLERLKNPIDYSRLLREIPEIPEIKPMKQIEFKPVEIAPSLRSPRAETRIPEPITAPPAPQSYALPTPRPDPRISALERQVADLEREQQQRDEAEARQDRIDAMDQQRRQIQQRNDRDFRRRSQ